MKGFKIPSGRGFPGGRDATRLMKRMGIDMEGLEDVSEVVIRRKSGEITIKQPEVSVMKVGDQRIYQITGEVVEVSAETLDLTEDDVKIVAEQSGTTLEEAGQALKVTGGDLAKAILHLKSGRDRDS